jgi:hypothetical protein
MKKLLKNKLFFTLFILFTGEVFADTFGFIHSIKNQNAFMVSPDQSATILKNGDFLEEGSQMLVEEGGLVIFLDYFDHKYQLSSGGLVKFNSEGIELSRGYLRVKTLGPSAKTIKIETPNSIISFSNSEGVISFDPGLSKTDVVSFDGDFDLKGKNNLANSALITEGKSSSVKNDLQMGIPSLSAKTPSKTLDKIASIFLEYPTAKRDVASEKEGKILVIRANQPKSLKLHKRSPSSKEALSKKKPVIKRVPIHIIGGGEYRQPSSEPAKPNKSSKEIDSLIDSLKSH